MEKELTKTEKIDAMINILNTNLADEEKVKQLNDYLSYKEIRDMCFHEIYMRREIPSKLKRIRTIYEYYNANGLLKNYKDTFKCSPQELKERLEKINIIYKTIKNPNITEDDKAEILCKNYKNAEEFRKKKSLFIKFGAEDPRLISAREALDNFDLIYNTYLHYEKNNILKNAQYRIDIMNFLNSNNYLENYCYAEFVINAYLNEEKSYLTNRFLHKLCINNDIFEYCQSLIECINPMLYQKFIALRKNDTQRRYQANMATIRNLANGISTGYLFDGTEFNILEFYKRIPFKEKGFRFETELKDFIKRNFGYQDKIYSIISDYMYNNKIKKMVFTSEEIELKKVEIINGKNVTPENVALAFRYIEINGLPQVSKVYNIIIRQIMNNEITEDVIINEEQIEEKEYITIPYKLIRK